ncbi:MAG: ATPase, partial [Anaerovorax sp.]
MEKFYLDQYLPKAYSANTSQVAVKDEFSKLCKIINGKFMSEWQQETETTSETLRLQKKAILGYEQEVFYFKNKIRDAIKEMGSGHVAFPSWYESLEDGIYQENWGMAGMAEWFYPQYANSSSAKIIGKKLFFMEDGVMVKKTQTIEDARREQLVRAILLLTPEERLDREFHEVYMLDGTRITIFGGMMTKEGEDVIIFRRYIIPTYSFEEQVARGTIPEEAIPLFKNMIELGYNCAFTGAVRSAKTTFLSTWQSYENQNLEGVMVETDPEIPLHRLMPDAPIIQIIADNEKLKHISKNLLRSDADYFILAEAREGIALDTAVKIANKGTRRMKITFHTRDPSMFS